jgi:hypothetical protein
LSFSSHFVYNWALNDKSMTKKTITFGGIVGLVALIVVLGMGCSRANDVVTTDESGDVVIDRDAILYEAKENGLIMTDDETESMKTAITDSVAEPVGDLAAALEQDFKGWQSAALADVTGGGSYGLAHAQFVGGKYSLVVEMGNLPVPGEGYFYEGWVVRRGESFSAVSTGRAEVVEEQYVNVFMSPTDYSDYDFYVLTLEPDDGDPAPDEHILEGTLK